MMLHRVTNKQFYFVTVIYAKPEHASHWPVSQYKYSLCKPFMRGCPWEVEKVFGSILGAEQ